jgi:hypothetical protein
MLGPRMTISDKVLFGKKVLLLAPAFFNYEAVIKQNIEKLGAVVYYYDERSIKSTLSKALLKTCPTIFNIQSYFYFNKIISKHAGSVFDYILIIKCDMISEKILVKFKKAFPNAKLCLHLWDSERNIPNITKKIQYFNHITSFDRNDCIANNKIQFRPLFFSESINSHPANEYQFDIVFCGTIHSDRFNIIKIIEKQCNELQLKFYKFPYLQSLFMYYYYRLFNNSFRGTTSEDFSFKKRNQKDIYSIEMSSQIILDIQHPKQSGLTMRTIEILGMRKKLITTNIDIANYDFYDSSNIHIIDRKDPKIDKKFLAVPYKDLPESVYDYYYIDQWILDVLGIGDTKN